MTPQQKIKWLILNQHAQWKKLPTPEYPLTAEAEQAFDDTCEDDKYFYYDETNEVRASGTETGLPCPDSGYYEANAVATQLPDGSWVGWTYFYGSGKHGNPEEIEWIADAYDVSCVEQEVLTIQRTFAVVGDNV